MVDPPLTSPTSYLTMKNLNPVPAFCNIQRASIDTPLDLISGERYNHCFSSVYFHKCWVIFMNFDSLARAKCGFFLFHQRKKASGQSLWYCQQFGHHRNSCLCFKTINWRIRRVTQTLFGQRDKSAVAIWSGNTKILNDFFLFNFL